MMELANASRRDSRAWRLRAPRLIDPATAHRIRNRRCDGFDAASKDLHSSWIAVAEVAIPRLVIRAGKSAVRTFREHCPPAHQERLHDRSVAQHTEVHFTLFFEDLKGTCGAVAVSIPPARGRAAQAYPCAGCALACRTIGRRDVHNNPNPDVCSAWIG